MKSNSAWIPKIYMLLFLFSIEVSGMTYVLIADEATLASDVQKKLSHSPDYLSLIDLLEAELGMVSRELTQRILSLNTSSEKFMAKQNTIDTLISEVTAGFLSPTKKRLLQKLIALNDSSAHVKKDQIETLYQNPGDSKGTVPMPITPSRPDDQIYINGYKIEADYLEEIKLQPEIKYHISYLSNVYFPVFQWIKGKDLTPTTKIPLIRGNCKSMTVNGSIPTDPTLVHAMFPSECVKAISSRELSMPSSSTLGTESIDSDYRESSKNTLWATGGSALLLGLLLYETQRKYDISVSWHF
jgi:hypothetical protein